MSFALSLWLAARRAARWAGMLLGVLAAFVLAETPPARALDALVEAHRAPLLLGTGIAATLGFVLMMGGVLDLLIAGRGEDRFTLRELKAAGRSGAWLREPAWRRRYVVTVGALLLFLGMFGVFFALGPGWIRLIVGAAILYALFQIGRGLARA